MINDIIKINDIKFCFISTSSDNKLLILVIFNLYKDDNYMTIRYYSYDMYTNYGIFFYNDLRGFLFNNYISVAFSHYLNNNFEEYEYYSSLIIFNFPNNTNDQSVDLLEYSYLTNNQFVFFQFYYRSKYGL